MESYELLIKPSAVRELEALPSRARGPVVGRIESLARDPRPRGCEKLTGKEQFRVRQGDLRILYSVDDGARTVTVVKIGHRRDVYS